MTKKFTFKTGLMAVATVSFLGTDASAGEYSFEFGKTDTSLSANATLSDFHRGAIAFSELSFSVDKQNDLDADLKGKAAFAIADRFDFSAEAHFVGETDKTNFRVAAGADNLMMPFGSLSFGLEATNEAFAGNATLADGVLFGLDDITITSEFQKEFDGPGEFCINFDGEENNGFKASGFASFDTANSSGFTAGFKVSGRF